MKKSEMLVPSILVKKGNKKKQQNGIMNIILCKFT